MEEFSKCREFIEFLQSSGLDRLVELPEIAVLGDTSSGKSSVLTNISSIELPSAHDICTRCPTRIIMKNSKLVSFAVRVLWNDKSMAIHEYENVTASNITEKISKAQSMILEKEGKKISNSVVEVRVSGEEYMDLTLTDLPGIVRTRGVGESEEIIGDINSLLTVALKNSKTIILAVHPANVDFHNSQILTAARTNDPDTTRTLPIITKVDLVPEGSEVGTMELLLGKKTEAFALGFHAVKLRSQKDLQKKVSIKSSLKDEESFFAMTEPWSKMDDRSLLGVNALVTKLSKLYVSKVTSDIPLVKQDIKLRLCKLQDELQHLGDDLLNESLRRKLCNKIESFCKVYQQVLRTGKSDSRYAAARCGNGYTERAEIERLKDVFATDLLRTKPLSEDELVTVYEGGDAVQVEVYDITEGKYYLVEADFPTDVEQMADFKSRFLEKNTATKYTFTPVPGEVYTRGDKDSAICTSANSCRIFRRSYTLDELEVPAGPELITAIARNRSNCLMVFSTGPIFEECMRDVVNDKWRPLGDALLDSVLKLGRTSMAKLLAEIKTRFVSSPLFLSHVGDVLDMRMRAIEEDVRAKVSASFTRTMSVMYTSNHYLNDTIMKKRNASLLQQLESAQVEGFGGTKVVPLDTIRQAIKSTTQLSIQEHTARELSVVIGAYTKVLSKILIDEIPQILEFDYVEKVCGIEIFDENCSDSLLTKLLSPAPLVIAKRSRIEEAIKNLQLAEAKAAYLKDPSAFASAAPAAAGGNSEPAKAAAPAKPKEEEVDAVDGGMDMFGESGGGGSY